MVIRFDRFHHAVRVPVQIGGNRYRFLVDTGIGITVVSSAVAARDDVRQTGESMTGRRMSGQEIRAPLVLLSSLQLGDHTAEDHLAAVADLGDDFDGIIGPSFYAGHALAVDPAAMTLALVDAATALYNHSKCEWSESGVPQMGHSVSAVHRMPSEPRSAVPYAADKAWSWPQGETEMVNPWSAR